MSSTADKIKQTIDLIYRVGQQTDSTQGRLESACKKFFDYSDVFAELYAADKELDIDGDKHLCRTRLISILEDVQNSAKNAAAVLEELSEIAKLAKSAVVDSMPVPSKMVN